VCPEIFSSGQITNFRIEADTLFPQLESAAVAVSVDVDGRLKEAHPTNIGMPQHCMTPCRNMGSHWMGWGLFPFGRPRIARRMVPDKARDASKTQVRGVPLSSPETPHGAICHATRRAGRSRRGRDRNGNRSWKLVAARGEVTRQWEPCGGKSVGTAPATIELSVGKDAGEKWVPV